MTTPARFDPARLDRDYHARRMAKLNERHRAQARRSGAVTGPVDALAVLDRDKWVCAICGDAIDPAGREEAQESGGRKSGGTTPDANKWLPSLDHIVPLARGGSHTMDNLRAAHTLCTAWRDVQPIEVIRRERALAAEVESFLERRPAASTYGDGEPQ